MDKKEEKGEIVLYQPDGEVRLEVRVENETVWLNRQQLALLFNRDIKTVGKHITNALREECQNSVVAKFATTADDGKIYQVEHYDLDMILSVGYRVKSANGIKFRRWANQVESSSLQLVLEKFRQELSGFNGGNGGCPKIINIARNDVIEF